MKCAIQDKQYLYVKALLPAGNNYQWSQTENQVELSHQMCQKDATSKEEWQLLTPRLTIISVL